MFDDLSQIVMLLVFVIGVVAILYQQYKAGQLITMDAIVTAVARAKPRSERVREIVEGAVLAAEQVKRDKKLTNEQAHQEAWAAITTELELAGIPVAKVPAEEIINEMNRAILIASNLSAQIEAAKGTAKMKPVDTRIPLPPGSKL